MGLLGELNNLRILMSLFDQVVTARAAVASIRIYLLGLETKFYLKANWHRLTHVGAWGPKGRKSRLKGSESPPTSYGVWRNAASFPSGGGALLTHSGHKRAQKTADFEVAKRYSLSPPP